MISIDVDGAFDRVWWDGLVKKLKARGMRGRALRLMKSYLNDRFIEVVAGKLRSLLKKIFSGVPQGGKFSQNLWNFDISTLDELDIEGLIAYADDCGILYEISDNNRDTIIEELNKDFESLAAWGIEWHTSFAADKTEACLISRKHKPFDVSGLSFQGEPIDMVKELKLVGFIFDEKMTMEPMVRKASKKGRAKVAALYRLRPFLSSENLELMYKAYIRSGMEYGNLEYMIAAPSTLKKLDRVQAAAEKLGEFKVESLESRREASLIGLTFKLLDGKGRGQLNDYTPEIVELNPIKKCRHTTTGLQVVDKTTSKSLLSFERSIVGKTSKVWAKLPQDILKSRKENNWQSITKECQRFLTGKTLKTKKTTKTHKQQKQDDTHATEYHSMAEVLSFKKAGILPLGFNEFTKILRSENLQNTSDSLLIKPTN